MERESFVFYRSFLEAIDGLDESTQFQILKALAVYGIHGEEITLSGLSKNLWALIKPQLDANNKKYQDGKHGGRPQKITSGYPEEKPVVIETENQWLKKSSAEKKPNANVNENVNENVNANANENGAPAREDCASLEDQLKPNNGQFTTFVSSVIYSWNNSGAKPEYRSRLAFNLNETERRNFQAVFDVHPFENVEKAIKNYAHVQTSGEYDIKPYASLITFLGGGVDKYLDISHIPKREDSGTMTPEQIREWAMEGAK